MSLASRKLIQATAGATTVDTGDDDFANVVLLLDGDGTSGDDNNTFTDSSTNGLTASPDGTVVQGSFSPYGDNWSNYFDGDGDYLISDTNFTAIGTDDFTIEFWYNGGAQPARYPCIIGTLDEFSANGAWRVMTYNDNANSFQFTFETTNYVFTTTNYNDGVWRHFAVTREGTSLKGFVDGVQQGSTETMSNTLTSRNIMVGGQLRDDDFQEGFISNARVIKGTALYTSDFTPPTEPLSAVTETEFLSCQSNRFLDNSTNNFSLSTSGTPKVTPFSPFKDDDARDITTDGGSAYFDGGDHDIQWGASGDLALGSGAWSVETWFYMNALPSASTGSFIDWRTFGSAPTNVPITNITSTGYVQWYANVLSGVAMTSNVPLKVGEWTHIVFMRSGDIVTMNFNGTAVASYVDSRTFAAQTFGIGNIQTNYGIDSYYSDLRVLIGSSAYSGDFTPPTEPLTAVTDTELLASFQDAGIYDRTGINNLDTVGNAQIDTAVKKYGTGSMEFDGSGDSIDIEHKDELNLGTGDSTIEFWVSLSSGTSDNDGSMSKGSGGSNTGWQFIWNNTNEILFIRRGGSASSPQLESGNNTVYRDNTWHHVAVTTSGTTIRMFLNGTQVDSYTDTDSWDSTEVLRLGTNRNNNNFMAGYLDDVRITKGVARYTADFTPPTEALPKF